MKERPILFSAAMVRAILAGEKTQTRRVVKPQPYLDPEWGLCWTPRGEFHRLGAPWYCQRNLAWNPITEGIKDFWRDRGVSPYGGPGDRLWVRETWGTNPCYDYLRPSQLTRHSFPKDDEPNGFRATAGKESAVKRWRPSIFMPRWASRILLEVLEVRVERLQEISEADAEAEGTGGYCPFSTCKGSGYLGGDDFCRCADMNPQEIYRLLWESINGQGSWATNPWVWVIEFRRITQ